MKANDFILENKENNEPFRIDIENKTLDNEYYREVLYTAPNLQLTVMNLKPGEEIGEEVHDFGDQFIRIEAGKGEFVLNGDSSDCQDGDIAIIPQGVKHNVVNTGNEPLKLYSIYTPPEHPEGTIHKNKSDDQEHN